MLCHGFPLVIRRIAGEYIDQDQRRKSAGIRVVCRLAGFLPVPRVTADSAGRGSCQGWPEATAQRLGLDCEEPCGHFLGSEGQLVRLCWPYLCDEACPAWGRAPWIVTRESRSRQAGSYSSRGSWGDRLGT